MEARFQHGEMMKPNTSFEKAAASGDFDLLVHILERAQAKFERSQRCRIKAIMRRLHRLAGIWLGEDAR